MFGDVVISMAATKAMCPSWRYKDGLKHFFDTKWSVDDFEQGRLLGEGRFGRVVAAKEKKTGFPVALKVSPGQALSLCARSEGQR